MIWMETAPSNASLFFSRDTSQLLFALSTGLNGKTPMEPFQNVNITEFIILFLYICTSCYTFLTSTFFAPGKMTQICPYVLRLPQRLRRWPSTSGASTDVLVTTGAVWGEAAACFLGRDELYNDSQYDVYIYIYIFMRYINMMSYDL